MGLRWLHIVFGVAWIGLLWYFNLVQVPAFAAFGTEGDGPKARNMALDQLARRALWYFRWAAVATVVTGLLITGFTKDYFSNNFGSSSRGLSISTGILLGLIMFLNVWGVIWRNQKVVLANAANVLAGGQADPNAAAAGRAALHRVPPEHHLLGQHDLVHDVHQPRAAQRAHRSSAAPRSASTG